MSTIKKSRRSRADQGFRYWNLVLIYYMNVATRPYRMTTRAVAAAETAEKILYAASHLFAENVIAEITLADIAECSGVTVQTILRRFGDKDGVFAEAMSRLGTEILSQRGQACPMTSTTCSRTSSSTTRHTGGWC